MKKTIVSVLLVWFCMAGIYPQAIIINHNCTQIIQIPEQAIVTAKQNLHIAYGHTSHGSQLTDGMTGLVAFMNGRGYPANLYAWNNGGSGGALDLHDYAMGGDVGYYPDWVNNTRSYLGAPNVSTGRGTGTNADVNVIIWSWCGQVDDKYAAGTLNSEYLVPMSQLEADYPGIKFVYMTGHLDHWNDANNKAANQFIRDFCINNNKILYDFADIESYDPDKIYFQYSSDDCNYYSASGVLLGNWATEWQNSHTENVDWYDCGSAHSQPLNANQKAYAAWWLWAALAGWNQVPTGISDRETEYHAVSVFPNPSDGKLSVRSENFSISSIEIFDFKGRKIWSESYSQLKTLAETDLSRFSKGLYIMKINADKKTFTKKIFIR